jgi:hypothetical protein
METPNPWHAVSLAIRKYLEDYAFDTGECYHQPTEIETILLEDFTNGLVCDEDFTKAIINAFHDDTIQYLKNQDKT